ncbi:MAG: sigma-70 family RNA polymerase sigma factor [Pirellulaceae bacterium]
MKRIAKGNHDPMNDDTTQVLLDRYRNGDASVVGELFQLHRERLRRMVSVRLSPHVRSRVDESDILQETLLQANNHIQDYIEKPPMPFFIWLRWLTSQQINQCHRFHLDAQKRDARKREDIGNANSPLSAILATQFALSTPSKIASKKEMVAIAIRVLDQLKPTDREILSMRHFENMTNQEIAIALKIEPSNASTRYVRALSKLRRALDKFPGFSEMPKDKDQA